MLAEYQIRDSFAEPMDFTLYRTINDVDVPFNLSGVTGLVLHRLTGDGRVDDIDFSDSPSALSVYDAAAGVVRLLPPTNYWKKVGGWVKIHFHVTLGGITYEFFNRPDRDLTIHVEPEYKEN